MENKSKGGKTKKLSQLKVTFTETETKRIQANFSEAERSALWPIEEEKHEKMSRTVKMTERQKDRRTNGHFGRGREVRASKAGKRMS